MFGNVYIPATILFAQSEAQMTNRQRSSQSAIVHSQDVPKPGVGSLERDNVLWASFVDRDWRK
jgi:hypothetical protein